MTLTTRTAATLATAREGEVLDTGQIILAVRKYDHGEGKQLVVLDLTEQPGEPTHIDGAPGDAVVLGKQPTELALATVSVRQALRALDAARNVRDRLLPALDPEQLKYDDDEVGCPHIITQAEYDRQRRGGYFDKLWTVGKPCGQPITAYYETGESRPFYGFAEGRYTEGEPTGMVGDSDYGDDSSLVEMQCTGGHQWRTPDSVDYA